jgi:hypothetical protein
LGIPWKFFQELVYTYVCQVTRLQSFLDATQNLKDNLTARGWATRTRSITAVTGTTWAAGQRLHGFSDFFSRNSAIITCESLQQFLGIPWKFFQELVYTYVR